MHAIFRIKAYEAEHGPHFDEMYARKAVSKLENEDGTRGPHWSLEETTTLANQYGVVLNDRFNRYDWFVTLNMIYSDYYKVLVSMNNSNSTKHFVELAKAWLNDKDVDEGKMWYYYTYIMCDKLREAEMDCYEEHSSKYDEEEYEPMSIRSRCTPIRDYDDTYDREYEPYNNYRRSRTTRYVRY